MKSLPLLRRSLFSRLALRALTGGFLLATLPAAQGIEWVTVGEPGNPNHPTILGSGSTPEGSIPYTFDIGRYEVTNTQYASFLNAIAGEDPGGVYDTRMGSHALGGIARTGTSGNYQYTVKANFADKPVVLVSFWSACRFANWMENGQPGGDQTASTTEDGTYTLDPTAIAANTVVRNPGSRFALPTRPEWWKAGYYDAGSQSYWVSPAQSNTMMSGGAPALDGGNTGNLNRPMFVLEDVGSYTLSVGPHGTLDMGGNAYEWLDRITFDRREVAGGAFATGTAASNLNNGTTLQRVPAFADIQSGFRLVHLTDAATTSFRNAGQNPASYTATAPSIGAPWTATVDLSTTGHGFARVFGYSATANLPLGAGQVLLVGGQRYFQLPLQAGPLATWTVNLPADVSLIGVPLASQAIHVLGVTPFALSNAQDLTLGI